MANPDVSYIFTNGTTADASQVNQNFTSLINSLIDGTKSISIDSLTVGGTTTLNGSATFGNSASDDVTFTGSLASSIPIKTTNSFNIGSALLGLGIIYLGNGTNSNTVALRGGVTTSSYTLTAPVAAGSANDIVQTSGSGTLTFVPILRDSFCMENISLAASVAGNALTIALKDHSGSDLSSTSRGYVGFRSATLATGTTTVRELNAALSLTVSSGSTLGHVSGVAAYIYVYLVDNAGTVSLAVSSVRHDEGSLYTITAEGGAGAADSGSLIYGSSGVSTKAIRLIGRLLSTQATAGTWASAMTEISMMPFKQDQCVAFRGTSTATTAYNTGTTTAIPAATEIYDIGSFWATDTYTVPTSDVYTITAKVGGTQVAGSVNGYMQLILYVDNSAGPVIAGRVFETTASVFRDISGSIDYYFTAGQTIKVYLSNQTGGNFTANGVATENWIAIKRAS